MGEAGLKLVIADVVITGVTLGACPASAHKGHGYVITFFPEGNVLSHRFNISCQLVSRNVGKLDIRIMTHPGMPITAAHTRCHDLDYNSVSLRRGIGNVHNSWGFREGFI